MTRGAAQTARSPERQEFWDCCTAQDIAEKLRARGDLGGFERGTGNSLSRRGRKQVENLLVARHPSLLFIRKNQFAVGENIEHAHAAHADLRLHAEVLLYGLLQLRRTGALLSSK